MAKISNDDIRELLQESIDRETLEAKKRAHKGTDQKTLEEMYELEGDALKLFGLKDHELFKTTKDNDGK